jgi:hypothetical protein
MIFGVAAIMIGWNINPAKLSTVSVQPMAGSSEQTEEVLCGCRKDSARAGP